MLFIFAGFYIFNTLVPLLSHVISRQTMEIVAPISIKNVIRWKIFERKFSLWMSLEQKVSSLEIEQKILLPQISWPRQFPDSISLK